MKHGRGQLVAPVRGRWSVRKEGSSRATRTFETQREALAAATDYARNQGSEVYVFGDDGRIREHTSYSGEARETRG